MRNLLKLELFAPWDDKGPPVPKFETYRPINVHLVQSNSTTNVSQPHPSSGECLSPPLGGAFNEYFLLLVFEWKSRNANISMQTAKYRLVSFAQGMKVYSLSDDSVRV